MDRGEIAFSSSRWPAFCRISTRRYFPREKWAEYNAVATSASGAEVQSACGAVQYLYCPISSCQNASLGTRIIIPSYVITLQDFTLLRMQMTIKAYPVPSAHVSETDSIHERSLP